MLSTAIDLDDGTASLVLALEVAAYFELKPEQARKIAAEVGSMVVGWRDIAAQVSLSKAEIDRMASAFEHEDLESACSQTADIPQENL